MAGEFWAKLKEEVLGFPEGEQQSWGIPFRMGEGNRDRVILVSAGRPPVRVPLRGSADYMCFLHDWRQLPEDTDWAMPSEGLVVAEYEVEYADASAEVLPVRARFEVGMVESPGPAWLGQGFSMFFERKRLGVVEMKTATVQRVSRWIRPRYPTSHGRS